MREYLASCLQGTSTGPITVPVRAWSSSDAIKALTASGYQVLAISEM
jgi:hypothetical protein